jgi:periplasmic protein TonB
MSLEEAVMDFSEHEREPGKKFSGFAFVVLLHLLIVYALVTGLARKVVEVVKQPVETKIIEEVKPPPPKDLPPPPPPPKLTAPPPPFIPPPEVNIQTPPPPNTIAAVTNVRPENPVMPPPAPPAPAAPAAQGPAGPARTAAVVDASQCQKPEYPRKSLRAEEQGTVVLQFLIGVDGRVADSKVERSSGFRDLDSAARAALSLCKFKPGTVNGQPEASWTRMEYVWKIE